MSKEWHIHIKDFGLLRVSAKLIENLKSFRQLKEETPESGGVLIGMHLNSGGRILINDYTPPQKSDKQGRYLYHRSSEHNDVVLKIWKESNKVSTYVGLWHTHAEGVPSYSPVDKKDWLDSLNKSVYEGDRLFYFIVGQTHIRCWMGIKKLFINKIEMIGELDVR